MAWEEVEKMQTGGHGAYGAGWSKLPAVSVTRSGLTFNVCAVEAYRMKCGSYARLLLDREGHRLGIKLIEQDEDAEGAYLVHASARGGKARSSLAITCTRLVKQVPDARGRAFRTQLSAANKIIEVGLSPQNALK